MNRVILIGHVGGDPEVRYTPGGTAITKFSLATSRKWKDKQTGEVQEETSWHRCVSFGRQAEIIGEYVAKGHKFGVEGRLKYGSYEKDGVTHYTTDIVVENIEFLQPRPKDGNQQGSTERKSSGQKPQQQGQPPQQSGGNDVFDDDEIPF